MSILILLFLISCSFYKTTKLDIINSEDKTLEIKINNMIENQLKARGIKNQLVLEAMKKVARHKFVPNNLKEEAYNDNPLPILDNQTISQPYIVALMTELINPKKDYKVLEIGTGSGYQAAILAELVDKVYSVEIIKNLYDYSKSILDNLNYKNIYLKYGDGYLGWFEHAPYDAIIVTAAPEIIPEPLLEQLKIGGLMVIPVGTYFQELLLIKKILKNNKIEYIKESIIPVRFVPLTRDLK